MRLKLFVQAALLSAVVFGQQNDPRPVTWGGLRFGMTKAQVKAVLKDKVSDKFEIDNISVKSTTGQGSLEFNSNTEKLETVWLTFSRLRGLDDKPTASELAASIRAYRDVGETLLEKYGSPANRTGGCPTADELIEYFVRQPSGTIECTRLWRDTYQTIQMKMSAIGYALFLTVEYKTIPTDL
jgi:hypothetical protein